MNRLGRGDRIEAASNKNQAAPTARQNCTGRKYSR